MIKTKSIVRLVLISMLMIAAAPAYSSGEAMQIWRCEIEDGTTEKAIKDHAVKWLAAVRKINGGKDMKASVSFPVAVNGTGEIDMLFTMIAPNFESWGKFWDAYGDSEVAKMDSEDGSIDCPDSVVWETFIIK